MLPRAKGIKGFYLERFGIPDVRAQLTARYLLDVLSRVSFKSMLDIGCGNGLITCLAASQFTDRTFVGLERDQASVCYARRLAEQNSLTNVEFTHSDLEVESPTVTFDLITALAVFQFIRDVPSLLKKCHSALNDGGHLIFQLPLLKSPAILMRLGSFKRRLPDFREARSGFSEAEVESLLNQSGFQAVESTPVIKGLSVLAKEIFYLALSVHPKASFTICPLLNWVTVYDERYHGAPAGLFVVARRL